jgi:ParB/RepB/Spo0J family partition protein
VSGEIPGSEKTGEWSLCNAPTQLQTEVICLNESFQLQLHPEISKWRDSQKVDKKLKRDLEERGQLQNLVARRLSDGSIQLLAGYRRFAALTSLGKKPDEMDIKILDGVDDIQALVIGLKENSIRLDLNAVEEARAFLSLKKLKLKPEDIGKIVKSSPSYVKSRLALLKLPEKIQQMILEGEIKFSFAAILNRLTGFPEAQLKLAEEIKEGTHSTWQGIRTVEKAEEYVAAVFAEKRKTEQLLAKYGACPKCGGKLIGETYRENELKCHKCGYAWHKETKEPWTIFEMRDRAKNIGFELKVEAPGKATLSPAELAELVEHQREQSRRADAVLEGKDPDEEPVTPTIRSKASLHAILMSFIKPDNILNLSVDDSEIRFKVIKPTELHFVAVRKDYNTGEPTKVTIQQGWQKDESVAARKPGIERFLEQLEEASE